MECVCEGQVRSKVGFINWTALKLQSLLFQSIIYFYVSLLLQIDVTCAFLFSSSKLVGPINSQTLLNSQIVCGLRKFGGLYIAFLPPMFSKEKNRAPSPFRISRSTEHGRCASINSSFEFAKVARTEIEVSAPWNGPLLKSGRLWSITLE